MYNRRDFILDRDKALLALSAGPVKYLTPNNKQQRVVVLMIDGLVQDYISNSEMPTLQKWKKKGFYKAAKSVFPSVTNTNNASICCGVWLAQHGITGNSFFNRESGEEEYKETSDLLLAPTLFMASRVQSCFLCGERKSYSQFQRLPACFPN